MSNSLIDGYLAGQAVAARRQSVALSNNLAQANEYIRQAQEIIWNYEGIILSERKELAKAKTEIAELKKVNAGISQLIAEKELKDKWVQYGTYMKKQLETTNYHFEISKIKVRALEYTLYCIEKDNPELLAFKPSGSFFKNGNPKTNSYMVFQDHFDSALYKIGITVAYKYRED